MISKSVETTTGRRIREVEMQLSDAHDPEQVRKLEAKLAHLRELRDRCDAQSAAAVREYERVLCPACTERFVVEGYSYCAECIRIGRLLEFRRSEHHALLESLRRDERGLNVEYQAQQEGAVSNWHAFALIGIGNLLLVIGIVAGWHLGKWAIPLLARFAQ